MKYGQHLLDNIAPEYGPEPYLNYRELNDIIRVISGKALDSTLLENRQISLTTPPPTNSKGQPSDSSTTEESFFTLIDKELSKVEKFTLAEVTLLRKQLHGVENAFAAHKDPESIKTDAEEVGENFIRLEKYVNLNFMGFHKILKKHDRYLPANPCKSFYVNRMHSQAWVRGDYSDLVVRLSNIFAGTRNDADVEETDGAAQSFLRSTTKYWIKTKDVSRVKYTILRNLPVFLQKTSTGETDSQLTNSVYLDNDQLELYHGRLEKTPEAIALRFRWYGTGEPKTVFVERKMHRDSWSGEMSVKERFIVDESEVEQIMTDTYPIEEIKRNTIEVKGTSQQEADEWEMLATEITQVIHSKQLVPTVRTQCMRTAFQIPFDPTVRISLDTNLCMISERGYDIEGGKRWYRDASKTIQNTEITRFPHAVLEVKLELKGDNMSVPTWVEELQNSGMLYEVHKFSKFIHGASILLPDDVASVPYWVDDVSLRESIISSGAGKILVKKEDFTKGKISKGVGPGANEIYNHFLPFGSINNNKTKTAKGRTASHDPAYIKEHSLNVKNKTSKNKTSNLTFIRRDDDYDDEESAACCFHPSWFSAFCSPSQYGYPVIAPTSIQKVEPKIFFANERTFLHWVHAGVTLSSIAAGILAFSEESKESWAHWYAMALMPIALGFILYALQIFIWRNYRIKDRIPGAWDDVRGPIILGSILVLVLSINFVVRCYTISKMHGLF